jgi:hypothetical protein
VLYQQGTYVDLKHLHGNLKVLGHKQILCAQACQDTYCQQLKRLLTEILQMRQTVYSSMCLSGITDLKLIIKCWILHTGQPTSSWNVGNVRQVPKAVHAANHQKVETTTKKVRISIGSYHSTFSMNVKMHLSTHCTKNADKELY